MATTKEITVNGVVTEVTEFDHSAQEVDDATTRALSGGEIDQLLAGKVPTGRPRLYSLPLSDGHSILRASYYAKNDMDEMWVYAAVNIGAAEDGTVSKILATLPEGYRRSAYFFAPGMIYHNGIWSVERYVIHSNGTIYPYDTVPVAGDIAIFSSVYYI